MRLPHDVLQQCWASLQPPMPLAQQMLARLQGLPRWRLRSLEMLWEQRTWRGQQQVWLWQPPATRQEQQMSQGPLQQLAMPQGLLWRPERLRGLPSRVSPGQFWLKLALPARQSTAAVLLRPLWGSAPPRPVQASPAQQKRV